MTKSIKIKPQKHLHLYKRYDLVPSWKQKKFNRPPYLVFMCQKPACSSRIPIDQALNKICECNRCGNPMILDKQTITLAKPHCQDCIVHKNKSVEIDALIDLIKDI